MFVGEWIAVGYIILSVIIVLGASVKSALVQKPADCDIFTSQFWQIYKQYLNERSMLYCFFLFHCVDVGFDWGVLIGWYTESQSLRDEHSELVAIPIIGICFQVLSSVITTAFVWFDTNDIYLCIAQLCRFEFPLQMFWEQKIKNINDSKYDSIFRIVVVLQCFPMALLQTYILVAYSESQHFMVSSEIRYVNLTFFSVLSSMWFITAVRSHKDSYAVDLTSIPDANSFHSYHWLLRFCYRGFEIAARVLSFTFVWLVLGPIALLLILLFEYIICAYNIYYRLRTDLDQRLFLHPIAMEELVSFSQLDWKLKSSIPPRQMVVTDAMDWFQCWIFAYFIYNLKCIRNWTKQKPQCSCFKQMNEYWVTRQQMNMARQASASSAEKITCAVCSGEIDPSHYFRCPSFLSSPRHRFSTEEDVGNVPDHGRYSCHSCGYHRMSFIPFLFVMSRVLFTTLYLGVIILVTFAKVKCTACLPSLDRTDFIKDTSQPIFILTAIFLFLYPNLFLLVLRFQLPDIHRKPAEKDYAGKFVKYAKLGKWEPAMDLARTERENGVDINEVDAQGRTGVLYAAAQHRFDIIRELHQLSADLDTSDISGASISIFFNQINDNTGHNALTAACKSGNAQDVHLVLRYGGNPVAEDGLLLTPLMMAAKEGELEILNLLVEECKVDINYRSEEKGISAAMLAAEYGRISILKRLIELGVDITAVDKQGREALEYALDAQEEQAARFLHNQLKLLNKSVQVAIYGSPESPMSVSAHTGVESPQSQRLAGGDESSEAKRDDAMGDIPDDMGVTRSNPSHRGIGGALATMETDDDRDRNVRITVEMDDRRGDVIRGADPQLYSAEYEDSALGHSLDGTGTGDGSKDIDLEESEVDYLRKNTDALHNVNIRLSRDETDLHSP